MVVYFCVETLVGWLFNELIIGAKSFNSNAENSQNFQNIYIPKVKGYDIIKICKFVPTNRSFGCAPENLLNYYNL